MVTVRELSPEEKQRQPELPGIHKLTHVVTYPADGHYYTWPISEQTARIITRAIAFGERKRAAAIAELLGIKTNAFL